MPFRHGRAPVLDLIGDDPAIHPLRKTLAKVDGYAGLRRAEGASAPQAGHPRSSRGQAPAYDASAAPFPGCCATRRPSRRGALLIRGRNEARWLVRSRLCGAA
jgi:hypothetical protein